MLILVNDEPLDFSLEEERTLGEVIDAVADWLAQGQAAVTAIATNGVGIPIHDRTAWEAVPTEEVSRLSIEAKPTDEVQATTLSALDEFFALLDEALIGAHDEALDDLSRELPFVIARLASLFPSIASDQDSWAIADSDLSAGRLPPQSRTDIIIREISRVRTLLQSRAREFSDPERETFLTLGQLTGIADTLVEVPVLLQTGAQAEAMAIIVQLTELLSRVVRMLPRVSSDYFDKDGLTAFTQEITPFLGEMQRAFETEDSVLIGDLLEYEVAPRVRELKRLVPTEAT